MIFRDQRAQFRQPSGHDIKDNATDIQIDLLCKRCNAHTRTQPDVTVIGQRLTTDKAQQRRFALTVAAKQTDALTTEHLQLNVVQQRAVSKSTLSSNGRCPKARDTLFSRNKGMVIQLPVGMFVCEPVDSGI